MDSITARYLLEVGRPVLPLPENDLTKSRFLGRYLSRPMFLEAGDVEGLERDLSLVWSALAALPQRLFDGDVSAFARAVGMAEFEIQCVMRSQGPSSRALTRMARADLYRDDTGFRLLEWNLGSPLGGIECVELCRTLLAVPEMATFVAKERLSYCDTTEAMLATLRSETGYPPGTTPVVALVGNPGSFAEMEPLLAGQATEWAGRGLSTLVGHVGELARSDGRLWLRGEPVDVVYRLFAMDEVLVHSDDGLLEPLLSAAECGEVVIFTPLDAELFGSKGAIALLSENHAVLTTEELDACVRLVPWTRLVRAGKTSVEDGSRVDLLTYVLEHQDDLVLKPSLSHGGKGVVVGADPDVTPAVWRDRLAAAVEHGSHVVQRLIRPVPELFPSETPGDLAPWTVAWGVFVLQQSYAGTLIRAIPADAGDVVVNFATGALIGCSFHAEA